MHLEKDILSDKKCLIKIMVKIFLMVSFILTLNNCHFYDKRVIGKNNSNVDIIMAISRINPSQRSDILSPFIILNPGESKSIYLFKDLDYSFLNEDSVSVLVALAEYEEWIKWDNGYYEYECLLSENMYTFHNLSVDNITSHFRTFIDYPELEFRTPCCR